MIEYVGKWWITLWSSKNMIVEMGIGENSCVTNSVYQVRSHRFLWFYISIARPTLKYLRDQEDIKQRGF